MLLTPSCPLVAPRMETHYWLPAHVCACLTTRGAVLLDLRRNRYFGLDRKDAETLCKLASNWPQTNAPYAPHRQITQLNGEQSMAEQLIKEGILSRTAPAENTFTRAQVNLHDTLTSLGHELGGSAPLTFRHVVTFFHAYAWARWALRTRSLYSIARRLHAEKTRESHRTADLDLERTTDLVCTFRRLRPYAFTAKNQCLFHALALTKFLFQFHIYPTWIIGVCVRPWGAHSWVQSGTLLLDSNPEHVVEFTPIMAV